MKRFLYSRLFRDRWQLPDRVLEIVDAREGEAVADLGAGGGYFTYRLARAVGPGGTVYAVDTDPDMIEQIRDRAERKGYRQIQVVHADADAGVPQLPGEVDAVLTVNAFHHLPDDRVRFFTELADSLSRGGRVVVVEARPRWSRFGHATEPAKIRSALEQAGYTGVETDDFLPRQSLTAARRPAAEGPLN